LDGKVLSVLEEHGLTPFHETGGAFNPRTQEAVGQPPRNESFIMRPLRCGFRRGNSVVRREKVEFSSISRSLVESVS
ncbi:MAG: nucleotide exchange factor GrpE, partial [Phycisphaerae bacterium]